MRTCRSRPCLAIANECPILTPVSKFTFRSANDLATLVNSVIVTLRANAQRYCVVERVLLQLHRLHRSNTALVKDVAKMLLLVRIDPILVHLKKIVGLVRPRAFPVER